IGRPVPAMARIALIGSVLKSGTGSRLDLDRSFQLTQSVFENVVEEFGDLDRENGSKSDHQQVLDRTLPSRSLSPDRASVPKHETLSADFFGSFPAIRR